MNIYPTPADLTNWIAPRTRATGSSNHLGHLIHDRAFRVTLAANRRFHYPPRQTAR